MSRRNSDYPPATAVVSDARHHLLITAIGRILALRDYDFGKGIVRANGREMRPSRVPDEPPGMALRSLCSSTVKCHCSALRSAGSDAAGAPGQTGSRYHPASYGRSRLRSTLHRPEQRTETRNLARQRVSPPRCSEMPMRHWEPRARDFSPSQNLV